MATNKNEPFRDAEFEGAFAEDQPAAETDNFGLMPGEEAQEEKPAAASPAAGDAAETSSMPEGEPAAVVIVADGSPAAAAEGATGPGDASSESSANATAAQEAKAANDEANANASDNKSELQTTGQAEAAGGTPAPAEGSKAEEAAEPPAVEAAEQTAAKEPGRVPDESVPGQSGDGDVVTDKKTPMTEQQLRSWEGRLRKAEADLKAKAGNGGAPNGDVSPAQAEDETTADALEQVADKAETSNPDLAAAAENVADQVASGEMSTEEAMKALSEDFGEQFVRMIEAIARSTAGASAEKFMGEKISKLEQDTQGVIDHLTNSAERAHFEKIFAAHPDFVQVSQDPQFSDFVANQNATEVVEHGSAEAINKLLADFKASKGGDAPAAEAQAAAPAAADPGAGQDQIDEGAADAAEGVRSAGLKLPEQPSRAEDDDFETAWAKF